MARGVYDGLTGQEILELVLVRFREELSKEGRLQMSQVYHNVEIEGEFSIRSYPHEPEVEKFKVAAKAGKEAPKEAKAEKSTGSFKEEHPVPDLARERIEKAKHESSGS